MNQECRNADLLAIDTEREVIFRTRSYILTYGRFQKRDFLITLNSQQRGPKLCICGTPLWEHGEQKEYVKTH